MTFFYINKVFQMALAYCIFLAADHNFYFSFYFNIFLAEQTHK